MGVSYIIFRLWLISCRSRFRTCIKVCASSSSSVLGFLWVFKGWIPKPDFFLKLNYVKAARLILFASAYTVQWNRKGAFVLRCRQRVKQFRAFARLCCPGMKGWHLFLSGLVVFFKNPAVYSGCIHPRNWWVSPHTWFSPCGWYMGAADIWVQWWNTTVKYRVMRCDARAGKNAAIFERRLPGDAWSPERITHQPSAGPPLQRRHPTTERFIWININGLNGILAKICYMEGIVLKPEDRSHDNCFLSLSLMLPLDWKRFNRRYVKELKIGRNDEASDCFSIFICCGGNC